MAKPKKTAARKSGRKTARRATSVKSAAAPGKRRSDGGLSALVSEVLRTLRGQQEAIERLVALHETARQDAELPAEPNNTVGAIPNISLMPGRAA